MAERRSFREVFFGQTPETKRSSGYNFFRQGIGRQLIQHILQHFSSKVFTVETGLENIPASTLYKNFGFKEIRQWDTDHGVRKVRFKLNL